MSDTVTSEEKTMTSESIDTLDLMADEFARIKALAGPGTEIAGLCDRAVAGIRQRVPAIQQRDDLRAAVQRFIDCHDAELPAKVYGKPSPRCECGACVQGRAALAKAGGAAGT